MFRGNLNTLRELYEKQRGRKKRTLEERKNLAAEMEELRGQLPEEVLNLYDRLWSRYRDRQTSIFEEVDEHGVPQEHGQRVCTKDEFALQKENHIVTCPTCHRFLIPIKT